MGPPGPPGRPPQASDWGGQARVTWGQPSLVCTAQTVGVVTTAQITGLVTMAQVIGLVWIVQTSGLVRIGPQTTGLVRMIVDFTHRSTLSSSRTNWIGLA